MNACPTCLGRGASAIDKATGKTVHYCNCCPNLLDNGQPCGDEGRLCEQCFDNAAAEHAYLRGLPRHAVFNDQQAKEERNQELRDAGRGHLVSL